MSPNPRSSYPTTSAAKPPSRYIELRPKGEGLLITFPDRASGPIDSRRKRHALSQKNQRDRLKAALEQMARVLGAGGVQASGQKGAGAGVGAGSSGTRVELIEAAVEYIQSLEKEVALLRPGTRETTRARDGAESADTGLDPSHVRDG